MMMIQEQQYYWLIKESNEYEYTAKYYVLATFDEIKKGMRNQIKELFGNVELEAYITDNKIKFTANDLLNNYNKTLDYYYNFEQYEIEAIKKPNIKQLRLDCYDITGKLLKTVLE